MIEQQPKTPLALLAKRVYHGDMEELIDTIKKRGFTPRIKTIGGQRYLYAVKWLNHRNRDMYVASLRSIERGDVISLDRKLKEFESKQKRNS